MSATAPPTLRPESVQEAAQLMRELGQAGRPVAIQGAQTKQGWIGGETEVTLATEALDHVLEHNEGDFTAVLQAGVPLAAAQAQFAKAGQMLALDPPLSGDGGEPRATVGGVMATADSGPLRHRYGGVRDLVLGVTVVLSDGTVAKAGGRVIKNVAGYDLGKLFAGSYGTLGLIATVVVRLHPLPERTATVHARSEDAAALARAAGHLVALSLEADCLDVHWEGGRGELLVRFSGFSAAERADQAASRLAELGQREVMVTDEDEETWARQRARQREPGGAVIKVAAVTGRTLEILRATQGVDARVVSRPGLGLAWVALGAGDDLPERVERLRAALPQAALTALDGAASLPGHWPVPAAAALAVMERIKARFDPAHICRPGAFVGGI